MFITFLERKYHYYFIIALAFFFLFALWPIFLVVLFVYISLLILFRRETKDFLEAHDATQGVVLSPVNGKVRGIRKIKNHPIFGQDCIEIQISIPWWAEWSVRLPITGDITDFHRGRDRSLLRLFRFNEPDQEQVNDRGFYYKLLSHKGDQVGLQFIPCPLGLDPELIISPGDRGMRVANIGYFPLGGSVLVYLSQNYEIMIQLEDQVTAGETPLAGEQSLT